VMAIVMALVVLEAGAVGKEQITWAI